MRIHHKRRWVALAAAAAMTATVTASLATTSAGAQSGTTRGVSATEIKVAGMGASPLFFTEANMGVGAQARFARANKTGEIPGKRKINTVAFGDDKADPATSVQEERRLIQQEGVFAIVPTGTVFVQSEVPEQTHTPVLGYGIAKSFCGTNTKSYFFGFNGCVVPPDPKTAGDNAVVWADAAIKEGIVAKGAKPKIAIMGDDNPTGQQAVAQVYAAAVGNGMDVVYAKAPTPAPPAVVGDYSPYVRDVLATNPDIITTVGVSSDYIGIGKALQGTDFKGMYVVPAADPSLAKAIGPSYAWGTWAPPESASTTPAVKQMLDDIEAYKPGTPGRDVWCKQGWLAADQFVSILKKVGKDLTAEKFQQVAAKFTYQQKGLVGPTAYPKNWQYTAPACHAVTKTDGASGTYTVVEPYSCSAKRFPIKPYDEIVTP